MVASSRASTSRAKVPGIMRSGGTRADKAEARSQKGRNASLKSSAEFMATGIEPVLAGLGARVTSCMGAQGGTAVRPVLRQSGSR
jgi:hypothetical protein